MASSSPKFPQYQGGSSFTVFTAQGSNPVVNCKISGKSVHKTYDKAVKGYVYSCSGGMNSKIQFPKDENKGGLQLIQPFLVLQLFVPKGQHFSLELRATDTQNTRRKMYFSTSFSELKSTPLHCQIPLSMLIRNTWINLALHVPDLFHGCFRVLSFRSLDVIILGPVCKLRKIFTMRNRPARSIIEAKNSDEILPPEHAFATGIDADVQVIDMEKLQNLVVVSPNIEGKRDTGSAPLLSGSRKVHHSKLVNVAFGSRTPLPLSTVQIDTNLPHDGKSNNQTCKITEPIKLPHSKILESATHSPPQNRSTLVEKLNEIKASNPEDSKPQGSPPVWSGENFSVQEEPHLDELEVAPVIDRLPDLMSKHGQKLQKLQRREEKSWRKHQVVRHLQKESSSQNKAKDTRDVRDFGFDGSPPGSPPSGWDNNSNGVSDSFLFEQQFNKDTPEFFNTDASTDHCKSRKGTMNDGESFDMPFQSSSDPDEQELVHREFTPRSIKGELAPCSVQDQNLGATQFLANPGNHSVSDRGVDDLFKLNHHDRLDTEIAKKQTAHLSKPVMNHVGFGSSEEHWDVHEEAKMCFNESLFDMEKSKASFQERESMPRSGKNGVFDSPCNEVATRAVLTPSKRSLRNEKDVDVCSPSNVQNQQLLPMAYKVEARSSSPNKFVPPKIDTHAVANNQKDRELDLLYDPILDCYYDPKTNRYYELK